MVPGITSISLLLLLLSRFSRDGIDGIDGSPAGSPVPGILQARTLEWVAISFSNAWKWKVKVKSLSRVRLLATPWTAAYQALPSMGFSRQEYWSGVSLATPKLGNLKKQQSQQPRGSQTSFLGAWGTSKSASPLTLLLEFLTRKIMEDEEKTVVLRRPSVRAYRKVRSLLLDARGWDDPAVQWQSLAKLISMVKQEQKWI